ncbi:hypothetical protein J5N97_005725 [Dioscorea zingiberensis]|uniref:FLZ-type domain-containing protein n=1 Tax=Dioscorea zingiberensis TaxID=325984 RepID=A0A9D5DAA1_9LILI|nr:hypothetical protein J5N97_005725 [Dioscorea zingiberensis]
MLLGKRSRTPMTRTTSMAELPQDNSPMEVVVPEQRGGGGRQPARRAQRRANAELAEVQMPSFLRVCVACRRRLAQGRDIFMYRGNMAFCSAECRQMQINVDEYKEMQAAASMNTGAPPPAFSGSETNTAT